MVRTLSDKLYQVLKQNTNERGVPILDSHAFQSLNDEFGKELFRETLAEFIATERESRDEKEIPYMTTSIKADETAKMGIITDVKQELRKANALKINYSTRKGTY